MRVSNPPDLPTLLYDGECGFCRRWVDRLAETVSGAETRPFQEALDGYPEIPEAACRRAVQWIDTDGTVISGAAAGLAFWSRSSRLGRFARSAVQTVPLLAPLSEAAYRAIAASRPLTSFAARLLWGDRMHRPAFRLSGDLFLRTLGLIYLLAFLSLLVQVEGLIGRAGILPVQQTLGLIADRYGDAGYLEFPTLLWLWSTDTALVAVCLAGAIAGAVGVLTPYAWLPWVAAWGLYLSLVTVGRSFLSFQWDALLLEAGFLAIVQTLVHARGWAAGGERPAWAFSSAPTPVRAVSWAYRWLLFRLMFSSGVVKLTSGDPAWWNLTALTRHYETQPLPNVVAWYAHHLPAAFHTFACVVMFAVELGVPFLFFAPRRLRHLAAALTIGFQCLILLTGNYTWFNLLSIALCLWLIEDDGWPSGVAGRFRRPFFGAAGNALSRLAVPAVCLNLLFSSLLLTRSVFRVDAPFPRVVHDAYGWIAPYRVLNTYGLFAVMTQDRPEIVVEGSANGSFWEPYEFYYKPGDPDRPPPFVAPHQPRLDWQMWFAALGPIQNSPWFYSFARRLFEGSDPVRKLLSQDPFRDRPPRYLRARVFKYRFATPEERAETGAWWMRSFSHTFLPPIVRQSP